MSAGSDIVLAMDLSGFLLLLVLVPLGQAFPSGQVTGSCDDLTPRHHGLDSQNSSSPYTVSAEVSSFGQVTGESCLPVMRWKIRVRPGS